MKFFLPLRMLGGGILSKNVENCHGASLKILSHNSSSSMDNNPPGQWESYLPPTTLGLWFPEQSSPWGYLGQPDQHSSGAFTVILLLCQYFLHCVLFWSELPVCSLGPHIYVSWEIRCANVAHSAKASSSCSFPEGPSREKQHRSLSSSCGTEVRCTFG